jgi:hypothetical protein
MRLPSPHPAKARLCTTSPQNTLSVVFIVSIHLKLLVMSSNFIVLSADPVTTIFEIEVSSMLIAPL